MRRRSTKRPMVLLMGIVLLGVGVLSPSWGQNESGVKQLSLMVAAIPGILEPEKALLSVALGEQFGPEYTTRTIEEAHLSSINSVVNAGIFEKSADKPDDALLDETDVRNIAEVAYMTYQAVVNGAPAKYAEDLSLVGFARPITQAQLEQSAKALDRFGKTNIPPNIYEQIISYGMDNGWSGEVAEKVSDGLIRGAQGGLESEKLALTLIIGIAQELGTKDVETIVQEQIRFLTVRQPGLVRERERRDVLYQDMQRAMGGGVPPAVARELYTIAVEEKWSKEVGKAIFDGLIEGMSVGLTPERLATAMIVRIAQGLGKTAPAQMVKEEIEYVAGVEGRSVTDAVRRPPPKPIRLEYQSYVQESKKKKSRRKLQVYAQVTPTVLDKSTMDRSIESFLGVRYLWGGTTRRGTDCSGFTQSIYQEQPARIEIPRVSRDQYKVGSPVEPSSLKYGDLVFFNKNGRGRITHVGLYLGDGKFAQSTCSKGVTKSSFNKRYYQTRYVGARRIAPRG